MPAKKPADLVVRHETLEEKNQRISAENANKTGRNLPSSAPKELKGHTFARESWRRLMREFESLKAERVDSQDRDLLIAYCLTLEEEQDLLDMRSAALADWKDRREDVVLHRRHMIDYKPASEDATWVELSKQLVQIVNKVQLAYKTVLDIDARLDRKRASLLSYQQQMYLTPRSRAGVVPERAEEEDPLDEMEKLLGDPTIQFEAIVNKVGGHAV
jgi:phage terminase small subunit